MDLFDLLPENLSELSLDELNELIESHAARIREVAADPQQFVTAERPFDEVVDQATAAADELDALKAELASRDEEPVEPTEPDVDEPTEPADRSADLAALAERAAAEPVEPTVEPEPVEPVTAAAPAARRLPRLPARSRAAAVEPVIEEMLALVAGAGAADVPLGHEFPDLLAVSEAMLRRRYSYGDIPDGFSQAEVIARADWSHLYPAERKLGMDYATNMSLIAAATDPDAIRAEMVRRRTVPEAMTASGGLCAPLTPYYQLQAISTAGRPVRAALPSFNAERGGIRSAAPASLAAITTATGSITQAQDLAGGSPGQKTCQVIACPPFADTTVTAIFHCLQFGNLGARAFPELLAQWNTLVLAAQARLAETLLLTGIYNASTHVTAATTGLGAVGDLLGQILAAVNGMRSRHRMDPEAVLRIMLPDWSIDLMISDVIRGQFARFDTDEAKITALLRSFDVEPTFYIDSRAGGGQVFNVQTAAGLLEFPSTVNWFLFPEGSFIFLDGGSLELGLVRDSVLNKTNDFQLFGETWENVVFVGVESLSVTSTVCDNGAVSAPHATACPVY